MSLVAAGGGGTIGVKVLVAVRPATSVTRYVTEVFVPGMMEAEAVKVTTPVAGSRVHVPSPSIVTELLTAHVVVPGLNKHVAFGPVVTSPVPVARPDVPVMGVKEIVAPGKTNFVSGFAEGAPGGATVGVIIAST